ncbi:MAG: type II toxin-antitoxin system HigB family toxin [Nitrospirae bacterium]|nr:type II toxin-antitoxin system HigB family toxin [Magnetococcales bacterium]HAT51560.1 hypothetical protein [Alphaproteobacteria bacterium]
MHIISRSTLIEFWKSHQDAAIPLQAWYRTMTHATFVNFSDLKATFGSADYVPPKFTVFNIGGNKYRLVAVIHDNRRKVYIRAVLTHAEYARDDWKRE